MVIKNDDCTGCMVCMDVCPKRCIMRIQDDKGFFYPRVETEKCIHCKKCDKVCPVENKNDILIDKSKFYAAKNKDKNIQINSSSGGIFTAFADYVLENKGYVFGGGWKDNSVSSIEIKDKKELNYVRRSKYVQSDCSKIYIKIEEKLKQGEEILFTGTPCQVNALYRYIKPSLREKLYLIELVCHGVPSPTVWKKYLQLLSEKLNKKGKTIKSIQFKYKDEKKYYWDHPGFRVVWEDGSEYIDFSNNTWYENGYLGNLFVRSSCHNCHFKQLSTAADVTIGDFWGCKHLYPKFYDSNGVSVIAINSIKGEELFDNIKGKIYYLSISKEEAVKYNQRFVESAKPSPKSKRFWSEYLKWNDMDGISYDSFENLVNSCLRQTIFSKCIFFVRRKFGKLIKNLRK